MTDYMDGPARDVFHAGQHPGNWEPEAQDWEHLTPRATPGMEGGEVPGA